MNVTTTDETRVVPVTLNGETKNVSIRRASESHCWTTDFRINDRAARPPVAYQYPTGKKLHYTSGYFVFENNRGEWVVKVPGRNGRGKYCRIIGWATDEMRAAGTCRW